MRKIMIIYWDGEDIKNCTFDNINEFKAARKAGRVGLLFHVFEVTVSKGKTRMAVLRKFPS